jgi:hypothetical protein
MSTEPQDAVVNVDATEDLTRLASRARDGGPGVAQGVEIETQSQVALQPNPSSSQAVMVLLESDPELATLVVDAIKDGLRAMGKHWDKDLKNWAYEIDSRTRLQSAQLALHYLVGLPVQRNVNVNINQGPKQQVPYEEMLKRSPALREAAKRAIARAEEKGVE